MTLYKNCQINILHYGDTAECGSCQIRIDNDTIVVSYKSGWSGYVNYEGKAKCPGHYELIANGVNGHATLHRLATGDILEGFWSESGEKGICQIRLIM